MVNYSELINRIAAIERELSAGVGLDADALPTSLIPTNVYPCWLNRYAGNTRDAASKAADDLTLTHNVTVTFVLGSVLDNYASQNEALLYALLEAFQPAFAQRRGLTSLAYPNPMRYLIPPFTVLSRCDGIKIIQGANDAPYIGIEWGLTIATSQTIKVTN